MTSAHASGFFAVGRGWANPTVEQNSTITNAREHYAPEALYDTNGNPTRTITEPLVDGGQFAPQSSGNAAGNVYINARWQFNANGMFQVPFGIDLAANVFGRQGYPFPLFRTQALGADTGLSVLVTPTMTRFRYDVCGIRICGRRRRSRCAR